MADEDGAQRARRVLEASRTIAVVGASRDPRKAAHRIPADLAAAGYRVLPVNPTAFRETPGGRLFGQPVVASLADLQEPVDLVNVFRPPRDCPQVAHAAVAVGAKALWLQLGITSPEAAAIARQGGLDYVEDRCTGADRRRWGSTPAATG